ncbi:MAG: phospho-sugar mutase [Eubacterium sp.]|nr:phospho-sugar mutase [Eubacterium sp.]
MSYQDTYQEWIENPYFDDETKAELKALQGNEKEIEDRFYKELEFGTAGLRGVIGAGTNRMNFYTVGKATQGLANYILETKKQDQGVAIAFDSRRMSPEFADAAALCLNANGIKAYVFESLRPTPELSFAVRQLGCIAGINITASHNPAEYNGYKVYWEDGAQITPPHDENIMAAVKSLDITSAKTMDKEAAIEKGLYITIGKDVDDLYIEALKKQVKNQAAIDAVQKDIKIVYSPLHGTGNIPARRILKELGFENVYVVKEQELPDGDFPTVGYPNPESEKAFELAKKLGDEVGADLLLATDPDADRLGVYVKGNEPGKYHILTGNMSGSLLAEYELSQMKEQGTLPADGALIKTIVTTNLADDIAKYYNIELIECLTGFKYIGQHILNMEQTGKGHYCFGFEESYGCLIGTHARDKDAIVATMALCEAAAYYKTKGMSLWDKMVEMYERYGYWQDGIQSIELKGKEGIEKIAATLEKLRQDVPTEIAGYKVLRARDYKADTIKDMVTGEVTETGLPTSNVLYYDLEDGAWVCVRPSGTEPKLKFYYGVKGSGFDDAKEKRAKLGNYMIDFVNEMLK